MGPPGSVRTAVIIPLVPSGPTIIGYDDASWLVLAHHNIVLGLAVQLTQSRPCSEYGLEKPRLSVFGKISEGAPTPVPVAEETPSHKVTLVTWGKVLQMLLSLPLLGVSFFGLAVVVVLVVVVREGVFGLHLGHHVLGNLAHLLFSQLLPKKI